MLIKYFQINISRTLLDFFLWVHVLFIKVIWSIPKFFLQVDVEMGYTMVDASQGITFEIEICFEALENNHDELKVMQDILMQN